jgi:uncharacterized protein YdaU (DUF1376 family)
MEFPAHSPGCLARHLQDDRPDQEENNGPSQTELRLTGLYLEQGKAADHRRCERKKKCRHQRKGKHAETEKNGQELDVFLCRRKRRDQILQGHADRNQD